MMENKKPLGLRVIALIDLLLGFFVIISALLGLIDLILHFKDYSDFGSKGFAIIAICLSIFVGLLLVNLGIQTLKLSQKSRVSNIAIAGLGIISCLSNLIFGHGYDTPLNAKIFIFSLVFFPYFLWIPFYLTHPKIKWLFEKEIK